MRELSFIVDGDTITQDTNCNFEGMFPGKERLVMAKFTFSPEWKNFVKVAAFWSIAGAEYPPQALKDGESCMIPIEALNRPAFSIQILGKPRTKTPQLRTKKLQPKPLQTNKLMIYQRGGKV